MKMSYLVFAGALSVSTIVFASMGTSSGGGLGPTGNYADCTGELETGTKVSFSVRGTAIPTFIDSVLVTVDSNDLLAQLKCTEGGDVAPNAPSAGEVLWRCEEYLDVNQGYSVELERGGFTGVVTGQIFLDQIFPLERKVVGRLLCK